MAPLWEDGGNPHDHVTGQGPSAGAFLGWKSTDWGPGLEIATAAASTNALTFPTNELLQGVTTELTLFAVFKAGDSGQPDGSQPRRILRYGDGTTRYLMIGYDDNNNRVRCRSDTSGVENELMSAVNSVNPGDMVVVLLTYEDPMSRAYLNGFEYANISDTGSMGSAPDPTYLVGNNAISGGARAFIGQILTWAIWPYALTAGDAQLLAEDPFGLYRMHREVPFIPAPVPATVDRYYVQFTAAGGADSDASLVALESSANAHWMKVQVEGGALAALSGGGHTTSLLAVHDNAGSVTKGVLAIDESSGNLTFVMRNSAGDGAQTAAIAASNFEAGKWYTIFGGHPADGFLTVSVHDEDGVLMGQGALGYAGSDCTTGSGSAYINAGQDTGYGSQGFPGEIGGFAVYDGEPPTLTSVTAYEEPDDEDADIVALVGFYEGQGLTVSDSKASSFDYTLTGVVHWAVDPKAWTAEELITGAETYTLTFNTTSVLLATQPVVVTTSSVLQKTEIKTVTTSSVLQQTEIKTVDTAGVLYEVQYARPESDISAGSWSPSTGGDLYAMIDEVTPNDSDYIYSSTDPSNDVCEVKLESISTPDSVGEVKVIIRHKRVSS
jgi:hypothetical protein